MYKGTMRVFVYGQEMELYTIGQTAKMLKKSVETIRAWEREKVIPRPMFKNKMVRLYHPDEVEAMKKVLRKVGKYARKDRVRELMYPALREVRKELINNGTEKANSD